MTLHEKILYLGKINSIGIVFNSFNSKIGEY